MSQLMAGMMQNMMAQMNENGGCACSEMCKQMQSGCCTIAQLEKTPNSSLAPDPAVTEFWFIPGCVQSRGRLPFDKEVAHGYLTNDERLAIRKKPSPAEGMEKTRRPDAVCLDTARGLFYNSIRNPEYE
jgi:hypothetical protein